MNCQKQKKEIVKKKKLLFWKIRVCRKNELSKKNKNCRKTNCQEKEVYKKKWFELVKIYAAKL